MFVKEILIEALRDAGYDFITAAEHARTAIKEFLASGEKSQRICVYAGRKCTRVFKLTRRDEALATPRRAHRGLGSRQR